MNRRMAIAICFLVGCGASSAASVPAETPTVARTTAPEPVADEPAPVADEPAPVADEPALAPVPSGPREGTPVSFPGAAGSACSYTPFLHEGRSEPPGMRPWIMELVEVPGNVDGDFGLCAQQACVHGLVLHLGGAARWPEGRYHVEVETEWGRTVCDVALPHVPPPQPRPAHCAHQHELSAGCSSEMPTDRFGPVRFVGAPEHVRVSIARDEAPVVERTVTPAYTRLRDGWECAPQCLRAEGRVAF